MEPILLGVAGFLAALVYTITVVAFTLMITEDWKAWKK